MGIAFKKATKRASRLRMALVGPSGSGKTYTSLAIASALAKPIAVIDTERGSASKYADLFQFDVLELASYSPQQYIEAIRAASAGGYGTLIIDSLSHAWMGKDGALEMVDRAAKRSQSSNTFAAWRDVTPHHNALVDAILQAPLHIIATMRAKTEYVLEEDSRGKKVPKKIGIQPVQRDGLEYEFDVVADLNLDNEMVIGKTRCSALAGKVYAKAGAEVAQTVNAWLTDGAAPEPAPAPPPPPSGPKLADDSSKDVSRADRLRLEFERCGRDGTFAEANKIATQVPADVTLTEREMLRQAYSACVAAIRARKPELRAAEGGR